MRNHGNDIGIHAKAGAGNLQIVGADHIYPLFLELRPAVFQHIPGLHGKTANNLIFFAVLSQISQNVLRPFQGNLHICVVLFDFVIRVLNRRIIRHGRRHENKVRLGSMGSNRFKHILRGYDGNQTDKGRGSNGDRAGNQRDLRAPEHRHPGKGVAHLSGGMIGKVPDGIQSFLGWPGTDQHAFSFQIMAQRQMVKHILQQRLRFRQLSGTHGAAGKPSAGRRYYLPAIAAQSIQIILCHRVLVHIGVHRRRNQLGAAAGKYSGGEHIIGKTVGQLRADICGGRSNDDQIRALCKGNMFHLMHEVPVKGINHDLASGELLKGQRRDKLGGVLRHHHLNSGVLLDQRGRQCRCLIGRDSAGYAK